MSLWYFFLIFFPGLCIIFHISGYDTQAIVKNSDHKEYGLFQINDKDFCESSTTVQSRNICDISCDSKLTLTLFPSFFWNFLLGNLFSGIKCNSRFSALFRIHKVSVTESNIAK